MIITILIDNESWIIPYGKKLESEINNIGHDCMLVFDRKSVRSGDLLILIGCVKIFNDLHLNKNNIVIHESDLPKGKGWSPITWQVLQGKNKIPITLFEAVKDVDAGDIYLKDYIILDGTELNSKIKEKQGLKTVEMVIKFIKNFEKIKGIKQNGESSFYKRRRKEDSELNIHKTIKEQFNLLRVCDNNRYPAFFNINGIKYILKIEKC